VLGNHEDNFQSFLIASQIRSSRENSIEAQQEQAIERLARSLLKRMLFTDEDIAVWKQELGEHVESVSVSNFIKMLNKHLMKYGFTIVRITNTGDIDFYVMLPTSLLTRLFPEARDPAEARKFFQLCIDYYGGENNNYESTKRKEGIPQKYCKDAVEVAHALLD